MELSYKSGGNTFSNLVAVLPGKDRNLKPILVGAHYDSVISSFCADDNAAAVAIALCNFVVSLCQTIAACDLSCDESLATPESLENGVADTTTLEIELIKTVFGDSLESFLTAIQLRSLDSRQDLDELASRLQGFFRL
jgi:hypothetical protein